MTTGERHDQHDHTLRGDFAWSHWQVNTKITLLSGGMINFSKARQGIPGGSDSRMKLQCWGYIDAGTPHGSYMNTKTVRYISNPNP